MSACLSTSIFLRVALMVRCIAGSRGVREACSCAFSLRSSCSCFSRTDRGVLAVTVMALLDDDFDADADEDEDEEEDELAEDDGSGRRDDGVRALGVPVRLLLLLLLLLGSPPDDRTAALRR